MLSKLKGKLNKRVVSSAVVACTVVSTVTNCFAAEGESLGTLPSDVTSKFSSLAVGLVATIGSVAAIALLVYAAPQAILFAKKIFRKVGS